MSYTIAIPTYQRPETLVKKTMRALQRTNVDLSKVDLWVATEAEESVYRDAVPSELYGSIRVGVRGIPNQRNLMQRSYPEGHHLVMIDDDISAIKVLEGKKPVHIYDLDGFINEAFQITKSMKLRMWGIQSNTNALQMSHGGSKGFIYIVGNFIGLVNSHDPAIMVDEGERIPSRLHFRSGKESHERVALHFRRYGGVVKFKNVGVESKYWGEPGGHQVSRTKDGEQDATEHLCRMFPGLFKPRVFNGIPDLTLRTKTTTFPFNFIQRSRP